MTKKVEKYSAAPEFLNGFVRSVINIHIRRILLEKEIQRKKQEEELIEKQKKEEMMPSPFSQRGLPELPPLPPLPQLPALQPPVPSQPMLQRKSLIKRILPNRRPQIQPRLPPPGVIPMQQVPYQQSAFAPSSQNEPSMPPPPSPSQQSQPAPPPSPTTPPTPSKTSPGDTPDLGRLNQIFHDPTVLSIECPGPDKNVMVNKGNRIETTSIRLTKNEVDTIMQEISSKTRIPLVAGMFKAAHKDMVITAVISDFVGSRFILQKRVPGVVM